MNSTATTANIGDVASLQRRVGGIVSTYILLQLVLAPLLYPHGYTGQLLLLSYLAYHVCYHQPTSTVNSSNATMKEMILQLLEVTILIYTFMDLFFAHQQQRSSSSHNLMSGTMDDPTSLMNDMFRGGFDMTGKEGESELCFEGIQAVTSNSASSAKERTFSEFLLRFCFLFLHMYYSDRIQGIVSMILPHHTQDQDSSSSSTLSPMVTFFLVGELILSPYLYPMGYLAQLFLLLFLISYFILCDGYVFHNHQYVAQYRAMKAQEQGKAMPTEEEDRLLQKETYEKVLCKICYMHSIDTVFLPCAHTCCICCTEAISHSTYSYGNNQGKCPFCNVSVEKKVSIYFP